MTASQPETSNFQTSNDLSDSCQTIKPFPSFSRSSAIWISFLPILETGHGLSLRTFQFPFSHLSVFSSSPFPVFPSSRFPRPFFFQSPHAIVPPSNRPFVPSWFHPIVRSCFRSVATLVLSFRRAVVQSFRRAVVPSFFHPLVLFPNSLFIFDN